VEVRDRFRRERNGLAPDATSEFDPLLIVILAFD
jgi:hypothetical protein